MQKANQTIGTIDVALQRVSKQRADLGAYQNRLEFATKGLDKAAENIQAAESRIRDTDMAKRMVSYSKNNILVQSATSMLAQANQKNQNVLQLLRQ
jgi:flagellin